ncbi:MAG: indolepyruvate oxidoreductase subunit beta family protein [Hyphomicrobiaceae bacterium]|nr:indolepyruvate oxidoreductase subunit beta family protein [Hyphomicrobiaceae bacterium]
MTAAGDAAHFSILIAALGGEGGGVLLGWIVEAARRAGLPVQATSVPGVAQRTGSTSYYVEMLRAPASEGRAPVFALVPMPGRVDVVVASELVEAARMLERGFVSPRRTTLIASSSRTYTNAEKMQMGDGRLDPARIEAAAAQLARRLVMLDLAAIARAHGTMVSATMFGALAGAGVLPWPREISESVLGDGTAAKASRAGFSAAFAAAASPAALADVGPVGAAGPDGDPRLCGLPPHLREIAGHGLDRVTDYQDDAYGALYLQRLERLAAAAGPAGLDETVTSHALIEAARRLALWMAYEDVPRVADLKSRPERFRRIRGEAAAQPGQVLHVTDYLKPGVEEIAAALPAAMGRRLTRWAEKGHSVPFLGRGIRLRSTTVSGRLLLRLLARLKHVRRRSLRYAEEQQAIEAWLGAMECALARAPAFAAALADLPHVLKGYGDTLARGRLSYRAVLDGIVRPAMAAGREAEAAPLLRQAIAAALADADHDLLDALLASPEVRALARPGRSGPAGIRAVGEEVQELR